jgi:hypothetical protein
METVIAANTSQEGKQVRQSQWLFLEAGDRAVSVSQCKMQKESIIFTGTLFFRLLANVFIYEKMILNLMTWK